MYGHDNWRLGLDELASAARAGGAPLLNARSRPTGLLPRRASLRDFECARPSADFADLQPAHAAPRAARPTPGARRGRPTARLWGLTRRDAMA